MHDQNNAEAKTSVQITMRTAIVSLLHISQNKDIAELTHRAAHDPPAPYSTINAGEKKRHTALDQTNPNRLEKLMRERPEEEFFVLRDRNYVHVSSQDARLCFKDEADPRAKYQERRDKD